MKTHVESIKSGNECQETPINLSAPKKNYVCKCIRIQFANCTEQGSKKTSDLCVIHFMFEKKTHKKVKTQ